MKNYSYLCAQKVKLMEQNNLKAALSVAIRAALAAGRDIMEIYNDPNQDFGIERKADNSPLTLADKAAHRRIADMMKETGLPMLSEEGAHESYEKRKDWVAFWLVDPLDGTKEFIKRNGEFTVNIALVENGVPVLGVIYVPVKQQLYHSKMEMKEVAPRPFTVVASRSHLSPETAAFIEELRKEHPDLELISSGSSLKICLVAEGKADIYPRHAPTMEWDTAAGDAIARAAGCIVMDAQTGTPLVYNKEDLHNPWFIVSRVE